MSGRPRGTPPPPHGTRARYQHHQRHREVPCKPCCRAQADYCAQWRCLRDRKHGVLRHTSRTDLYPLIAVLAELLLSDECQDGAP